MDVESTKRLVRAVQELSLARNIDRVMEIVRTEARELTGADGATFVLKDNDMCYYADEDAISPLWKGSRFPMHTCVSGWSMLNKKAAIIEDIYQDDRIPHDAYRPTFVKSLVMVPIRKLAPIGAIGNYWAKKHLPTEDQVTLLQSLADITAVTMENINIYVEFDQRVKDRTSELEKANRKLQEAYKELEAFSYSVSHDLRTPLRLIIGYSDMLFEDDGDILSDGGKEALNVIRQNANRMNLLIDDLLRFSRLLQKGLEKAMVDSNKLVDSVIKELDHHNGQNARFIRHPLSPVSADPVLLSQVWSNLISNAVKYSSKNKMPVIELGCNESDDELVFFVKDNGVGFDMKYADKLFGVFQRLHHSRDFEGSGIGLALVKRIINRHGGRVWAEGKANDGATFFFALPGDGK